MLSSLARFTLIGALEDRYMDAMNRWKEIQSEMQRCRRNKKKAESVEEYELIEKRMGELEEQGAALLEALK